MQFVKRAFIYGFLLWIIPFLASVAIYPLKKTDPAFFQSILGVMSITLAVVLTVHYFQKVKGNLKEGIFLGMIFLFISWFFDFLFFIWGPIKMPLPAYIKEIGIGYLVYPVITIAFGYLLGRSKLA
jgi:ABC-type tungstate transport system substrate-binding protein